MSKQKMVNQTEPKETKLFSFKCDEHLLKAFQLACESQDITASQALRAFMRDYVSKHGQGRLF